MRYHPKTLSHEMAKALPAGVSRQGKNQESSIQNLLDRGFVFETRGTPDPKRVMGFGGGGGPSPLSVTLSKEGVRIAEYVVTGGGRFSGLYVSPAVPKDLDAKVFDAFAGLAAAGVRALEARDPILDTPAKRPTQDIFREIEDDLRSFSI